MGWSPFYNDRDPDNILSEVTSFVDKFQSVVERCDREAIEWDNRQQKAFDEYNRKRLECEQAHRTLTQARNLANKMLNVFE